MNPSANVKYTAVAIYAIFIGSQVTEAFLLVPYWQSLSAEAFYAYYAEFGPIIGRFYTILTIMASLIPVAIAAHFQMKKKSGTRYAVISAVFALLVIAAFYAYFKGVNSAFYERAFSEMDLQEELIRWGYWHWSRISLEITSLAFMIIAFGKAADEHHA